MRRPLLLVSSLFAFQAILGAACTHEGTGGGTSASTGAGASAGSTGTQGPDASSGGGEGGGSVGGGPSDGGPADGDADASESDGGPAETGAPSPVVLGTPSPAAGSSTTAFLVPVTSTDGSAVTLDPGHVLASGPDTSGCAVSVLGSGTAAPVIRLSGCTGNGPVTVSTTACAAPAVPPCAGTAGPSTAVIVSNPGPDLAIAGGPGYSYAGASGASVPFELYFPTAWQSMPPLPVYIHVHGGGWTGGTASSDAPFAQTVARRGFIVANIDYTLAPSFAAGSYAPTPYTAGPDDVDAFIRYATDPAVLGPINANPTRVSIGGSSAGAHLALVQATRNDGHGSPFHFRCVLDAAGPTDLTSAVQQATLQATIDIVHGVYGANPPAWLSPALNASSLRADRLLILHAEQDSLVPFAQAAELASSVAQSAPWVELTRNYWPDPNPDPSTPSHVLPEDAFLHAATYLSSRCR